MSSLLNSRSSIIAAIVLFFCACSDKQSGIKEFKRLNLQKTPLFHYNSVGMLNEAPMSFVEPWNRAALQELGIKRITLYSKGGKNPDDTLEKITFSYSGQWETLAYKGFKFDETADTWTSGTLTLPGKEQSGTILFDKHFGIDKESKTLVKPTRKGYLLLHRKTGNRYDSTWVVGALEQPDAIITKIGRSVFSIELFLPEGSSTNDIVDRFGALSLDGDNLGAAQRTVTFTQNGRPLRTFLLNDAFSQVARIREWTYTKDANIATYQEWMGAALVRDMSWHYGKSQLPEYTTIDRNTYFYTYE